MRVSGIASPVQAYLERLHATHASMSEGAVATYIPELAKANPDWFGICLATTDGRVYEVGDTRQPFTIQSISKPLTYGLALEDHGRDAVLCKIGVEPSGDAFNSISLVPGSGCPRNPMINAGAIAAASLVAGHNSQDRLHRLLSVFSLYAGRNLSVDEAVYQSEKSTGHRNRAIAHMLRNFDIIADDPEPALDLYFQQCSIAIDCRDLSLMAATLANGGVNPQTGERAVSQDFVDSILSVMTTCGMYDFAGEWVYSVGMPAKSGVGGGILAVLPGQLGIGTFSPRLDARGNSVRGVAVCKSLSRDFNLHFLRVPRTSRAAIRSQYSVAQIRSKRLRDEGERSVLDQHGGRSRVYELHGDLVFSTLEAVVRHVVDASEGLDVAVIDLRRVTQIEEAAAGVLLDLVLDLGRAGKRLLVVHAQQHPKFLRFLDESLGTGEQRALLATFPDMDRALEWCENQIITAHAAGDGTGDAVSLAAHGLCRGLTPENVTHLESLLERQTFSRGEVILRQGDPGDRFYLLIKGEVSITVSLPNGQLKRLSTLSPGMTFGEMAVIDRTTRSADVRADQPVECYVLTLHDFDRLGETHPIIKITILENLLRNVSQMVARLNREVAVLA